VLRRHCWVYHWVRIRNTWPHLQLPSLCSCRAVASKLGVQAVQRNAPPSELLRAPSYNRCYKRDKMSEMIHLNSANTMFHSRTQKVSKLLAAGALKCCQLIQQRLLTYSAAEFQQLCRWKWQSLPLKNRGPVDVRFDWHVMTWNGSNCSTCMLSQEGYVALCSADKECIAKSSFTGIVFFTFRLILCIFVVSWLCFLTKC